MRPKLSEKYANERFNISKQLIEILDLDSTGSFLLCDLDSDLEKQAKIMDLKAGNHRFPCDPSFPILDFL
jgi:hypothetical protein